MESQRGRSNPWLHSKSEAKTRLELNSPASSPGASPFPERLVLENKPNLGQTWLNTTYIYFLLAMIYPAAQALVIPGSADPFPQSQPAEPPGQPQSDHRRPRDSGLHPAWRSWAGRLAATPPGTGSCPGFPRTAPLLPSIPTRKDRVHEVSSSPAWETTDFWSKAEGNLSRRSGETWPPITSSASEAVGLRWGAGIFCSERDCLVWSLVSLHHKNE